MSTTAAPSGIIPAQMLLAAYASGVFPMADGRDDSEIYWVEPKERAILPLDGFNLTRSLAKLIRQDRFAVTTNRCFADVVAACAAPVQRAGHSRDDTWINPIIARSYARLHSMGNAHSVECWHDGALVGGLYGVSLGRAFFGESMFSHVPNASKVALAHLVARLNVGGFVLLDCQFMTDHLASMGAIEIGQKAYLERLYSAVSDALSASPAARSAGAAGAGDWAALDALLAAGAARGAEGAAAAGAADGSGTSTSPGQLIVQLLTNTS